MFFAHLRSELDFFSKEKERKRRNKKRKRANAKTLSKQRAFCL